MKPGAPRATSYSQGFSISKIFNYILKFFWPSAKPKCSAVRQESKKENISKETVFNKVASLEEGESLGGPRKAVNNLVSYLLLPKAFISPEGVNKKIKEAKIAIDAATASLSGINDGEKRAIQNFVFREILTEACKELLLDDRRKIMDALGRKMI